MPSAPSLPDENAAILRKLTAALAEERARCERLEGGIRAAAEREQQRLAQALHDTISQSLTGIHLMAEVLARKHAATAPEAAADLAELSEIILGSTFELHRLITSLRPPLEP